MGILLVMAVWASFFYAYILDEVYDNVDDGLKNQKIEIIREAYENPSILKTNTFGINQFRLVPVDSASYSANNQFKNEMVYMPYDDEMEPYRVLTTGFYTKDGEPYLLQIRTSTVEEDDLIFDLITSLGVLYVAILLSILLINEFVLTKAYAAFRAILKNLHDYRFGNKNDWTPVQSNVIEFSQLNEEINQMINRNEQVFEEQKFFIENASHELQTPLAITLNRLDLLMEDPSLSENQLQQLAATKDAIHRLVSLNKSLLLLSRIDNKQYKKLQKVSFRYITRELLLDYEDLIIHKGIDLALFPEDDLFAEVNADLTRVLISNLLRNAINYTSRDGIIEISMNKKEWKIKNSAKGIPLAPQLIFRRFHKASSDKESTGLGLAIVKSIVDLYPSFSISYSFENNFHIFSLSVKDS